jgi:hypothetical protein
MRKFVLLAALAVGCAGRMSYVSGTRIPYSDNNRSAIEAVEQYRLAVERRDADSLMLMAHKQYWEDSGTPVGGDDYGYEGLRTVLQTRLQSVGEIRYSLRYVAVRQTCGGDLRPGCRAAVDVLIDASYTITDATGKQKRPDKRDQNQLVLEWDGRKWLFLSGM